MALTELEYERIDEREGLSTSFSKRKSLRKFLCPQAEARGHEISLRNTPHPDYSNLKCYKTRMYSRWAGEPGQALIIAYYASTKNTHTINLGGKRIEGKLSFRPVSRGERYYTDLDGKTIEGKVLESGHLYEWKVIRGMTQLSSDTGLLELTVEVNNLAMTRAFKPIEHINKNVFLGFNARTLKMISPFMYEDLAKEKSVITYRFLYESGGWDNAVLSQKGEIVPREIIKKDSSGTSLSTVATVEQWEPVDTAERRKAYKGEYDFNTLQFN